MRSRFGLAPAETLAFFGAVSTVLKTAASAVAAFLILLAVPVRAQEVAAGGDFSAHFPAALRGPFVADPSVVTALDCGTGEACEGPLNFQRLIEAKAASSGKAAAPGTNPFNLEISKGIIDTIEKDLKQIRDNADAGSNQLSFRFLTHPATRAELVGVVDRMDRQFIKDSGSDLTEAQQDCGEISLIYRFSYFIKENGGQKSRMPITMNIVFPALPGNTQDGAVTCQGVAKRWRTEYERPEGRSTQQIVADLLDPATGPLALIKGEDMLRIELNTQAYRLPAGDERPGISVPRPNT